MQDNVHFAFSSILRFPFNRIFSSKKISQMLRTILTSTKIYSCSEITVKYIVWFESYGRLSLELVIHHVYSYLLGQFQGVPDQQKSRNRNHLYKSKTVWNRRTFMHVNQVIFYLSKLKIISKHFVLKYITRGSFIHKYL